TQTRASSWTADVPSSVKGLRGSCVVIPCSYDYPAGEHQKVNIFTGISKTTERDQVIYHATESKILEQYGRRTNLVGNIREKNCSLMIQNLQEPDGGSFYFRIELEGYAKFSYLTKKVVISVTDQPNPISLSMKEEIKEGENVSASCSVSHSCPTYPPDFHWSHSGAQHDQTQKLHKGQWNSTSTLTFHSNRTDHNKPLQCTVTYHGGKQQETSKIIKIKYAPVNMKAEYQSDVNQGETVHLKCSSDANPVSSYKWNNGSGALLDFRDYFKSNIYNKYMAIFNMAVLPDAPDIKTSSKCSSYDGIATCECIVESESPSMALFVLGNRVLQSTKVEKNGSVTTEILQADFGSFKFVHCLANNILGNANLMLSLSDDNMQNILIASGAGVILLIILIATGVGVKKWNGDYENVHCNDLHNSDSVYGNTGDPNTPPTSIRLSPPPDEETLSVTAAEVKRTLKRINPCKAAGPDNIPGRVLRNYADQLG
ncbi:myelin-associated glycoprotein-like, partial [Neolamprologus brichardi]|uniref:myelin-associated glycoprotein-like n=1 Tax=Neolamprologus brichardi TaxID=32507 RepID=UPI001643A312